MGQESESEVISLLKDVQKRIGYLEKKIDMLSKQSSGRSSSGRSSSSRSPVARSASSRSYSPTHGGSSRYKDKHESSYGTKNGQTGSTGRFYEKKRGASDSRGSSKKKKSSGPAGKKYAKKS